MDLTDCPDQAELERFVVGDLPGASSRGSPVISSTAPRANGPSWASTASRTHCSPDYGDLSRRTAEALEPVPDDLLARVRSQRSLAGSASWLSNGGTGQSLGRFELLEQVGVGSFGYVFRARDTELGRLVAIKIPRAGHLASTEDAARFLREARSAAQLKHPGIVTIHETGQAEDGTFYLVEEFVQGTTLSVRLKQGSGVVPRRGGVDRGRLRRARLCPQPRRDPPRHQAGQHPARRSGQPHLMDFGLAKREAEETVMTQDGQVLGTPAYMSPEQARGESHRVDVRTDIYSTGVVLYELLTGERPFRGNRRMLILQVMDDEPRPPRQLNDKIPRDLETICLRAMAKSAARRYPTANELGDDLRRFLNGEPIRARPIGWPERLKRWFRRNPVAASLLVAVSLGSAVGLWHLSTLSSQLVQSTALEGAAQQAEMLEVVNSFYTSEVVDRVQKHGIAATHDYATKPGAIPLPVVFLIESGQRIGERSKSGMLVRLYSDHPFRSRKDGGPHDQFERDALDGLRQHPDDPVFRFESFKDRPSLRYATARRMDANCISCHNNDDKQHQAGLEGRRSRRRARDHPAAGRRRRREHARGCGARSF